MCLDPDIPSSVSLVDETTDSLTVRWNQTGGVDQYRITVNGSDWLYDDNNMTFTATISNLRVPGSIYCISVTAFKGTLSSSSSEFCTATGTN